MLIISHKAPLFFSIMGMLITVIPLSVSWAMGTGRSAQDTARIPLPSPALTGTVSVEEAIKARRTRRNFSPDPLSMEEWGQILWAAQGITSEGGMGMRAAPSAGALYPLDIYLIAGEGGTGSLSAGVYHYEPLQHALMRLSSEDMRKKVAEASLYQGWMAEAPGMILIAVEYARITGKYKERGIRYAHFEAGHVAQNCFLQAESLGLHVGIVGAFEDETMKKILPLPKGHEPLLILPVGRPR
ncbi:MAG: SagB/ThcOx family dehydrogenase [bacterium]